MDDSPTQAARPRRVFDCFTFFNELDLLELRFHELSAHVDRFVLVEATQTFQGAPKPLHYAENRARFAAFADRVIHVVVDDMPETTDPWARERHQREAIRRVFDQVAAEDIVIVSDADEILSGRTVAELRTAPEELFQLTMPMFQYFMNLRESSNGWLKVFAFRRDTHAAIPDFSAARSDPGFFDRFEGQKRRIAAAGWHFTYLGGARAIEAKLRAFSHTDGWHADMLRPGWIDRQIMAGYVVGNYWHMAEYVPVDESFPDYVRQNVARYEAMGFINDVYAAFAQLQARLRETEAALRERERGLYGWGVIR